MPVKRLKHWVLLLVLLFFTLGVVVFMLENQQSVIINLFGWPSAEVSVSTCVVIALLLGMVVGPFWLWLMGGWRKVNRRT